MPNYYWGLKTVGSWMNISEENPYSYVFRQQVWHSGDYSPYEQYFYPTAALRPVIVMKKTTQIDKKAGTQTEKHELIIPN